jgi:hypothetical protein
MFLVSFGNYLLAGFKFLGSLPVASISDPANPGSFFAIHPGVGLAHINGGLVDIRFSSKTVPEFPTNILEIATPSHRALPTPFSTATFDPRIISSQTGTGALVALNLLVVLWLFSLLALSLTYKPALFAIRTWLATLHCCAVETIHTISQSVVRIVLSINFDLTMLCYGALDSLAAAATGLVCNIQNILNTVQTLAYSRFKSTVTFALHNLRVPLCFGLVAAITNIIQQITWFCDINIPSVDVLLVIAASPAVAASSILFAVLLGFINPSRPNPPFITIVHPADMVAGMRVKQPKRFL